MPYHNPDNYGVPIMCIPCADGHYTNKSGSYDAGDCKRKLWLLIAVYGYLFCPSNQCTQILKQLHIIILVFILCIFFNPKEQCSKKMLFANKVKQFMDLSDFTCLHFFQIYPNIMIIQLKVFKF